MGLIKWLKSLVSEHLFTVNMLKDPKDCLNLHGSIFVKFYVNSGKAPKNSEIFFHLEMALLKLVALNTHFYCEKIFVIGCQYVKKQSQGFRY